MKNLEFRTATSAQGGLVVMGGVPGVAAGSRVQLRDHTGRVRSGQVIRTADDAVLVEVFEGTDELDLERTWVRFLDEPFKLPLSRDMLGRVFNGSGSPRDGRPPIISADRRDVNGEPLNPAARAYPREFIQTGISAIDGMNSLTRGQKLPIFSGGGLPHNRVAAQIVRQARLLGEDASDFVVVFAAFGASHADARFLPGKLRRKRRAEQGGDVPQPRRRAGDRTPADAARGAYRSRVPGLRPRPPRAGGDDRHDRLLPRRCAKWRCCAAMCRRARAIPAICIPTWPNSTSGPGASRTGAARSP